MIDLLKKEYHFEDIMSSNPGLSMSFRRNGKRNVGVKQWIESLGHLEIKALEKRRLEGYAILKDMAAVENVEAGEEGEETSAQNHSFAGNNISYLCAGLQDKENDDDWVL
jgi:hypothetical protein